MKDLSKKELKSRDIVLIISAIILLFVGVFFFLEKYINFVEGNQIFYVVMLIYFGIEFINYILTKKSTGMNSLYISLVSLIASVSGLLYGKTSTSTVISITLGSWVVAMIVIKLIRIEELRSKLNPIVFINLFTLSMFILLSFLAVVNIYKEITNVCLMMGFFYIVYGILNLIENIAFIKLIKEPIK